MYRPKGYKSDERMLAKEAKKKSWFKKGGYGSYIMVPATPNSNLKKSIDEKLRSMNLTEKVKIIEKPGKKFIEVLKEKCKKPKQDSCDDPKCLIGKTKNGGNCRKNEIVYEIACKECKDKYIGESARNGHTRGIEHFNDAESMNEDERERSVLLRHMEDKHNNKKVEFEMKVIRSYL